MTQSVKDQLVEVLDTEEMRNKHHYEVDALLRTFGVDPENLLAWEIRLSPRCHYIEGLEEILAIAKRVDEIIYLSAYFDEEAYILLL